MDGRAQRGTTTFGPDDMRDVMRIVFELYKLRTVARLGARVLIDPE
jgi:hypothetical protein